MTDFFFLMQNGTYMYTCTYMYMYTLFDKDIKWNVSKTVHSIQHI